MVKNPPSNADVGLIPGLRQSPGEGNGNPLQYPCLGNPMDRGVWWATVYGVTKSWTQLSWLKQWCESHDTEAVTWKSFSCVWLFATPWTVAYHAPPSMGFSRQEYWSGVPLPSPERHLLLLYWLHQSLWLCESQQTVGIFFKRCE